MVLTEGDAPRQQVAAKYRRSGDAAAQEVSAFGLTKADHAPSLLSV
jgi:hypothetical protein